jgi:hypothetical protein
LGTEAGQIRGAWQIPQKQKNPSPGRRRRGAKASGPEETNSPNRTGKNPPSPAVCRLREGGRQPGRPPRVPAVNPGQSQPRHAAEAAARGGAGLGAAAAHAAAAAEDGWGRFLEGGVVLWGGGGFLGRGVAACAFLHKKTVRMRLQQTPPDPLPTLRSSSVNPPNPLTTPPTPLKPLPLPGFFSILEAGSFPPDALSEAVTAAGVAKYGRPLVLQGSAGLKVDLLGGSFPWGLGRRAVCPPNACTSWRAPRRTLRFWGLLWGNRVGIVC